MENENKDNQLESLVDEEVVNKAAAETDEGAAEAERHYVLDATGDVEGDDESAEEPQAHKSELTTSKKRGLSVREIVLLVIAVIAIAAAICFGVLYSQTKVPDDAAAKVSNTYISEDEVTDYVAQYRLAYGLTDDSTWANYLTQQGITATTFRQNCINDLSLSSMILEEAERLGVTPSDEEVDEQINAMKSSIAFGDDETWKNTLEAQSITESALRKQLKVNLAQTAVGKAAVERPTATDDETLSYVQSKLAGVKTKLSYRIFFYGDEADSKAKECYERLEKAKKDMNTDVFSGFALSYSMEDNVQETGGYQGWLSTETTSTEYAEILNDLKPGEFSGLEGISEDGYTNVVQIIYCADEYTFPNSKKISKFKKKDVEESLWETVRESASDILWSNAQSQYISNLLTKADITYYPAPHDLPYAVDTSDSSSDESSSDSADSTDGSTDAGTESDTGDSSDDSGSSDESSSSSSK